jgi:hypothetical protein
MAILCNLLTNRDFVATIMIQVQRYLSGTFPWRQVNVYRRGSLNHQRERAKTSLPQEYHEAREKQTRYGKRKSFGRSEILLTLLLLYESFFKEHSVFITLLTSKSLGITYRTQRHTQIRVLYKMGSNLRAWSRDLLAPRSCGRSVSIMCDYRLDVRRSIPDRGKGFFL